MICSINKTRRLRLGWPEELAILVLDASFLIALSESGSLIASKGGGQEETYLRSTFKHHGPAPLFQGYTPPTFHPLGVYLWAIFQHELASETSVR